MNKLIQNGVKIMPRMPEILALKIAAGIFPFAMETITTDAETVEGNVARKKVAQSEARNKHSGTAQLFHCIWSSIVDMAPLTLKAFLISSAVA